MKNKGNKGNENDPKSPDDNEDIWMAILGTALEEAGITPGPVKADDPERTIPDSDPSAFLTVHSTLLGTYRIERDPIEGGMGSVWKVHHTGWDADLAMKRPKPEMFANEQTKKNFINECRYWIDLGLHPNIVSCYYVREIEGVPTIFSEWMENGSLENRIQDKTLYKGSDDEKQERLLDIAIQFARGLKYAHGSGLIHQDVKPDNLLLSSSWEAKVSDFGIANARAQLNMKNEPENADNRATRMSGKHIYTPAYCSCEQMEGRKLTGSTDIYSWAVSVMEMYCGGVNWANGVVAGVGCREYFSDCTNPIPGELQDLLAGCMEMEPENRPRDFAVIEKELLTIYRKVTGKQYPRPEPKAAGETADSLNNKALSYLDMGMPEEAEAYWELALEMEPNHLPSIYNQGLYLWRAGKGDGSDLVRKCSSSGETGERAERLISQIQNEQEMFLPSIFTGFLKHYTPEVTATSDGKYIFAVCGYSLKCWNTEHLKRSRYDFATKNKGTLNNPLLMLNGEWLMFSENKTQLCVVDAAEGKRVSTISPFGETINAVCSHHNGYEFYTGSSEGTVRLWNILIRKCEKISRKTDHAITSMCLSPDGKTLCTCSSSSGLILWDAESLEMLQNFDSVLPRLAIEDMKYSPDGKQIFICAETGLYCWKPGRFSLDTLETGVHYRCMCMDQAGTSLVTGDQDGNIKLWNIEDKTCQSVFPAQQGAITGIAASSDLELILTGGADHTVQLRRGITRSSRAPWELCKAKNYDQEILQQEEFGLIESEIRNNAEKGDIKTALSLLEKSEEKYGMARLFTLRRYLSGFCRSGIPEGSFEIGTLPFTAEKAGPASWVKKLKKPLPSGRSALWLDFDPNGDRLAVAVEGRRYVDKSKVEIWNNKQEITELIELPGDVLHRKKSKSLRFSPSGHLLLVGMDGSAAIWNVKRSELLYNISSWDGDVRGAFSPDEKMIAAGGDTKQRRHLSNKLDQVILSTGKHNELCWDENAEDVIFTADGALIAAASGKKVRTFDALTTIEKKIIEHYYDICQMILLPPGDRMLLVDTNNMSIWDIKTLERVSDYFCGCYDNRKDTVCVSPDGSLLAESSKRNIRIWSLETLKPVFNIEVPDKPVRDLAFSPDGCVLAAICKEDIHLWGLQRKLEFPGWKVWEEAADPFFVNFMKVFPHPNEQQIKMFLRDLKNLGFGYISETSVRQMIHKVAGPE